MSYNAEFYKTYRNYLQEPEVRQAHNEMLDKFAQDYGIMNTIDLGCGLCEYFYYGKHSKYKGVDKNCICTDPRIEIWEADYSRIELPEETEAFVSLFSTECCLSAVQKYGLYIKLFRTSKVKAALVSGFFYKGLEDEEMVDESCGKSYQTVESAAKWICDPFKEYRIYIPVPSYMFGRDVIEVWKFLVRNDKCQ